MARPGNYKWSRLKRRPVRVKKPETLAEQLDSLGRFAAHYKLSHRITVVNDDSLGKHYGLIGIPHVVLIDRAGRVRLIHSGSSAKQSQELKAMVEELMKAASD